MRPFLCTFRGAVPGVCLWLLTASPSIAQSLEEAEKQLMDAYGRLQSFTARLRDAEDVPLTAGDYVKSETHGTVIWQRKGDRILYRMEIKGSTTQKFGSSETKSGQTSTLVCDGELFYTLGEQLGQKLFIKQNRDSSINGDLRSMLEMVRGNNDVKRLQDEKIDDNDCVVVEITPRNKPSDADPVHRTRAWFRKDIGICVKVASFGKEGNETFSRLLYDLKINETVDPARFVLDPPPDAELRDLTSLGDKPSAPANPP